MKIKQCPVRSCAYHSIQNAHGCMLEGKTGVPEPGEISDAQIRRHKGLSAPEFKSEKIKAIRWIRRGIIINRVCEWMDSKPPRWFHLSSGFNDPEVSTLVSTLKKEWPWNIPTCNWTPGKILMVLRDQTWEEFEAAQGQCVKEPHLRTLRLPLERAREIQSTFVLAYKRAINNLKEAQ